MTRWTTTAVAALTLLCGSASRVRGEVVLQVEAGIGGVVKAGRIAPVHVTIDNRDDDIDGTVEVRWGRTSVQQLVNLPAPSRHQIELYIRAAEAETFLTVRLLTSGIAAATATLPLRVLPQDSTATLCVSESVSAAGDSDCQIHVSPAQLPRQARGYESVDRLLWRAGPETVLASEQRRALEHWRMRRALDDSEAPEAPRIAPPAPPASRTLDSLPSLALGVGIYLAVVAIGAASFGGRRGTPRLVYSTIVAAASLGSVLAYGAGRYGPNAVIVVRHRTTLQQYSDGTASVSMRARAVFPAADQFALTARLAESEMTVRGSQGSESPALLNMKGEPTLYGPATLGESRELRLEGLVNDRWLEVLIRGQRVRVTNTSSHLLHDCRLPGDSAASGRTLPSGESLEGALVSDSYQPFVTCRTFDPPVAFSDERYRVAVEGESLVSAYAGLVPETATGEPR